MKSAATSPPASPTYPVSSRREKARQLSRDDYLSEHEDHDYSGHNSSARTSLSSPPTSVGHDGDKQNLQASVESVHDSDNEGDHHYRLPSLSLSQSTSQRHSVDYGYDDLDSQWESETGGQYTRKPGSVSSSPHLRSRKSATPSSKIYPRGSRNSGSSSRLHLNPSTRRETHYFASRASSATYEAPKEERKAPLVLLHINLLLLPGAEEPILRTITPMMLERGMLIEHPKNDYQLLEELIFDALGLDEFSQTETMEVDRKDDYEKPSDDEAIEWEKSMGVRRIENRDRWELRVYAANGLMTQGAWRRVWNEMERIDVEVGPRDWRGHKTDELIRGFLRSSGDGMSGRSSLSPQEAAVLKLNNEGFIRWCKKWWITMMVVGLFLLAAVGGWWTTRNWEWTMGKTVDIFPLYDVQYTYVDEPLAEASSNPADIEIAAETHTPPAFAHSSNKKQEPLEVHIESPSEGIPVGQEPTLEPERQDETLTKQVSQECWKQFEEAVTPEVPRVSEQVVEDAGW